MNRKPIQTVEAEHKWLWLVYAAGVVLSCAASAFWPGCWTC